MRRLIVLLVMLTGSACQAARPQPPETIPAEDGDIVIVPITHATLQLRHGTHVIDVDPVGGVDYHSLPPATIVLITDVHEDHFDSRGIGAVSGAATPVVAPAAVPSPPRTLALANGERKDVAGVSVEAVPMYNVHGETFHDKGRGNGYIVTLGGKRIYVAGDTACTPEMRALKDIDVAFVPMNLPYTMAPPEAAECVKAFKPALVYPYHYSGSNPEDFVRAMQGSGIQVRLRNWYDR